MYKATTIKESAKGYLTQGFSVFPVHSIGNGTCTCSKPNCGSPGKHPLTKHGVKDATKDEQTVDRYFSGGHSNANIGIATGEPSGAWVLDIDDDGSGLKALEEKFGSLPKTATVKTGSGGRHYYFRHDESCTSKKNSVKFAKGLDCRFTGGFVVVPPSLTTSADRNTSGLTPVRLHPLPIGYWI